MQTKERDVPEKHGETYVDDELTAQEKVAIPMVTLGEENAAEVMKYLANFEIGEIAHIVTELRTLPTLLQIRCWRSSSSICSSANT